MWRAIQQSEKCEFLQEYMNGIHEAKNIIIVHRGSGDRRDNAYSIDYISIDNFISNETVIVVFEEEEEFI